jgi:DNA-binding response OmpR family regulator
MKTENLLPTRNPAQESFPNWMSSPPRILVAEDDFFLRQLEAEVLRCAGFEVDEVEDGAAAWDRLQRKNYDLLVTDNNMPMVSGVELLKRIHAAHLSLPIIMATGSLPAWEFTPDPLRQPIAILFKPYTIAELMELVQEKLRAKAGAGDDATPSSFQRQQPAQGLRL